jgi:hypothetical protein
MPVEQHEPVVIGEHREVPLDLGPLAAAVDLREVAPREQLRETLASLLDSSAELPVIAR